jgi:ABC-type cobalamin/Fe3+-siderophores transport system ATPase subunit
MSVVRLHEIAWHVGGVAVVDGVSFEAAAGEFIALMGRNGAGKSTILDLIAGMRRPSAGTVILDGRPLDGWTPIERARRVAHLPQAVRAELPFTVEQVVLMGRYPRADRWFESDADRHAAHHAMKTCDCLAFRDRRLSTLSGGERQRVLLAACLAQETMLLLLDEPSTFLDVDQQLHCFSLLRAEAASGRVCIAVTHDLNLALTFCTRTIVLADRTVAYDMPASEALARADWLPLFSSRLQIDTTRDGRPWVSYR